MNRYKIKRVKLNGISKYLWEIQYRGLFRYRPTDYGYFSYAIDAVERVIRENNGVNCIIRVDNGD
jgi:hypothetical protein